MTEEQIKMGDTVLPPNHPLAKAIKDTMGPKVKQEGAEGAEGAEGTGGELPPGDNDYVDPEEFLEQDPTTLEDVIAEAEQAAEMTYEQRVAEAGISMDEARQVINDVLKKGEYTKTYTITGDVAVTFRTRTGEDNDQLLEELERKNYGYNATIANHHTRFNLASSLVSVGSKEKMAKMDPEDLERTLRFVSKLPGPFIAILINKLVKFEQMVAIVLDEGAIQNF